MPWVSEEWTPEIAGIRTRIHVDADSVRGFRQLHDAWHTDGSSAARFTKPLQDKYAVSCLTVHIPYSAHEV